MILKLFGFLENVLKKRKHALSKHERPQPLAQLVSGFKSICITDYPKIYCLRSLRFLLKRLYLKRNVTLINDSIY